jgi:hypothetical protein
MIAAPSVLAVDEARVERVPDHHVDGVAEWVRRTDDDDVRGVDVVHTEDEGRWTWQVFVNVAGFLREEPLESEMRAAVAAAISSVAGVTEAAEEDREVWILSGEPCGEELVRAVGDVVDRIGPRARAHIDSLISDDGA